MMMKLFQEKIHIKTIRIQTMSESPSKTKLILLTREQIDNSLIISERLAEWTNFSNSIDNYSKCTHLYMLFLFSYRLLKMYWQKRKKKKMLS